LRIGVAHGDELDVGEPPLIGPDSTTVVDVVGVPSSVNTRVLTATAGSTKALATVVTEPEGRLKATLSWLVDETVTTPGPKALAAAAVTPPVEINVPPT
jgi:hypothetical protein